MIPAGEVRSRLPEYMSRKAGAGIGEPGEDRDPEASQPPHVLGPTGTGDRSGGTNRMPWTGCGDWTEWMSLQVRTTVKWSGQMVGDELRGHDLEQGCRRLSGRRGGLSPFIGRLQPSRDPLRVSRDSHPGSRKEENDEDAVRHLSANVARGTA
jgi:hypothetical protein